MLSTQSLAWLTDLQVLPQFLSPNNQWSSVLKLIIIDE
jgi:hypothetical protein